MLISQLADDIGGSITGRDVEFESVSTDTRSIEPGDLFVALKGEHFDAHQFLKSAFEKGAVAALVSDPVDGGYPLVHVQDTRLGLGRLAQCWISQYSVKKVAITGSSGKTSVKEMVAAILALKGPTLATKGNLNNDIGVPLTLCRIRKEHRFAVVEMGANHLGEIAYVSALTQPDVALVNNVGSAHLEGFGSQDNIALAKSEIYQGLAQDGIAVINLDDAYAGLFVDKTKDYRQLTYSTTKVHADIHVLSMQPNNQGQYSFLASLHGNEIHISLPLIGSHNVSNALAAMSICYGLGCTHEQIIDGLAELKAIPGRLYPVAEISSHAVIDDSYNANPNSMRSAIDVLSEIDGKRCLVLGAMAELGPEAAHMHRQIGEYAAKKGIETVYGLGKLAVHYRDGYLDNPPENGSFVMASSHQLLAQDLMANHGGETLLIKGSRSSAMEKVIQKIKQLNIGSGGSI